MSAGMELLMDWLLLHDGTAPQSQVSNNNALGVYQLVCLRCHPDW